jgi:thiosulfate/3-mercaptopyruvate sulfurtransferase
MIALLLASALVSPAELESLKPRPVVLDARSVMKDYLAGHVPGALLVAPDNWRSTAAGIPGEIHPQPALRALFGELGLQDGAPVVVYGAANDPDAALVASVLRAHGFEAAILDGGFERWTREQRAVSKELPRTATSRPKAPRAKNVVAAFDEILTATRQPGRSVLVDVRPPEQFEAGRLPGAIAMYWKKNLRPAEAPDAGLFRDAAELREAYRAIGVTPDKTVYVYCNSGHMASVGWFVLKVLLEYPDVRLYDGSWIDWSSRPDAPKESGKPGEAEARAAAGSVSVPAGR